GGEQGAAVVDEAMAIAEREGGLVLERSEVVVLVAQCRQPGTALVHLVGAGGGQFVAVGVELEALLGHAVAVEVAAGLALGAQRRGAVFVLPLRVLEQERELGVQAFAAGIAAGGGEAELAGAGPALGAGVRGDGQRQKQGDRAKRHRRWHRMVSHGRAPLAAGRGAHGSAPPARRAKPACSGAPPPLECRAFAPARRPGDACMRPLLLAVLAGTAFLLGS